ncbi:arylamine N-acetyltransferase family protein [Nocardiopsis ansamitocini]|uniref:Acetyltransferase n=1 Tax=Nocardiopsis ansamitocini TaxID=1670832 RepID=A0A9W6P6Z8_9ACTN|nr:arylamine N-acetyltransferase [Nocardiopsis ansamitocini]GLU48158.1 hypothetical protein Nans01_25090 [Nocardiopsis ansamitocini]
MPPRKPRPFDAATYLRRLGYSGPLEPTLATLCALHRSHLRSIPYDNTRFPEEGGPLPGNLADVDPDAAFDKIVVRGVGGICFELNLLMQLLLDTLGFATLSLAAGVAQDDGTFSPDLSHRFIGVHVDDELWLADVGFAGPSFIEPVRVSPQEQVQYGCRFKVTEQGSRFVLHRKGATGDWRALYRFRKRSRTVGEWDGFTERFQRFLGESGIVSTTMVGRATDTGHIVVVGRRHLKVDDGHETVSVLGPGSYDAVVGAVLGRGGTAVG